jgi:hypothetical protein
MPPQRVVPAAASLDLTTGAMTVYGDPGQLLYDDPGQLLGWERAADAALYREERALFMCTWTRGRAPRRLVRRRTRTSSRGDPDPPPHRVALAGGRSS